MTLGLQAEYVPKVLRYGLTHGGGMAFMAMTAGGSSLQSGCTKEEAEMAKMALGQVHACGVLHGDISAANFIRTLPLATGPMPPGSIFVVDFSESVHVKKLKEKAKADEMSQLDRALNICPA